MSEREKKEGRKRDAVRMHTRLLKKPIGLVEGSGGVKKMKKSKARKRKGEKEGARVRRHGGKAGERATDSRKRRSSEEEEVINGNEDCTSPSAKRPVLKWASKSESEYIRAYTRTQAAHHVFGTSLLPILRKG